MKKSPEEKNSKQKDLWDKKESLVSSSNASKPRLLKGEVVSNKMEKTIVVLVNRFKQHPKYGKRYLVSKKYKAAGGGIECGIGDKVVIRESRPISKDKKWVVVKKLS